jgi:AmiR/NasT family two-component response regulator
VKVLLADDDAERAVARTLAVDAGLTVVRLKTNESLADAVASRAPDVLLVEMARLDRDAPDGVRQVAALNPRQVVVFVDEDETLLIKQGRLSEPDAYKWLRRTAMSRGRRIVDVAGALGKAMEGNAG